MVRLSRLDAEQNITISGLGVDFLSHRERKKNLFSDRKLREIRDRFLPKIENKSTDWIDWVDLSKLSVVWPQDESLFAVEMYPQAWHEYRKLLENAVYDKHSSTSPFTTLQETQSAFMYSRLLVAGRRLFYPDFKRLPLHTSRDLDKWEFIKNRTVNEEFRFKLALGDSISYLALLKEAFPEDFKAQLEGKIDRGLFMQTFGKDYSTWSGYYEALRIVFPEWVFSQEQLQLALENLRIGDVDDTSLIDSAYSYGVLTCDELEVGDAGVKLHYDSSSSSHPVGPPPAQREF